MKKQSKQNGVDNNHWETPHYIMDYIFKHFFKSYEYIDPCPLHAEFDGLAFEWGNQNYINPPYDKNGKEGFIKKAYEQSKQGKLCVMLIPANTETKIFHEIIVPNAKVILIKKRIKFKGYNTKGEYVTNKTGQTGSMFVIFGSGKTGITTLDMGL
jgi:hypothetical protein